VGGPPRFGHLHGVVIRHAPGRAEVMPYLVGRSSNVPGDQADPFFDPHALDGRVGGDAMLRVTSNLTLNATINPDFGQVEVDPAVVNLSAFETFFDEKRPFFVEGAGYFAWVGSVVFFCSNVSSLSMLATRRIGPRRRSPRSAAASRCRSSTRTCPRTRPFSVPRSSRGARNPAVHRALDGITAARAGRPIACAP